MGSETRISNRAKWGGAAGVTLLVVLMIAVGSWFAASRDGGDAPRTEFTPVSELPTVTSSASPAATPELRDLRPPTTPIPHDGATPVGSPGATPETPAMRGLPDGACVDGCLVRVPRTDAVLSSLAEDGFRPSYEADRWVWAVVTRESAERLQDASGDLYLVHDSPETLYLYATRFPSGMEASAALDRFGTVIDAVNGHRMMLVEAVPPVVKEVVAERIWIEKVRPAVPQEGIGSPAGTGDALSEMELGVLMPQVSPQNMLATITGLQATSSTDGTGVGTRQYTRAGNVMATEYLFGRLEAYGLDVWYEDFITCDGYLVSNVVGEIPGRDETMIYGVMAHLDSTAESFDEAPGADDNGTGVAGSLEIARILSGYQLEHPVHVIFVNAEETAIIGAMAYAANVVEQGIPIEGVFNLDTIGNPSHGPRLILNSGPQSAWMTDLMIRINDGYGLGQQILPRQNGAIIADDTMLRNRGIEAVLVARLMAGDYTVHHTAADTIENLSIDNAVTATMLVLLSIGALCQ
jgi:hypothetical protein